MQSPGEVASQDGALLPVAAPFAVWTTSLLKREEPDERCRGVLRSPGICESPTPQPALWFFCRWLPLNSKMPKKPR